jgi:hypothetical protein
MPSYDKRGAELRNDLAGVGAALGAERVRIASVLDEYLAARDAALTTMTVVLEGESADVMAPDYNSKIRDQVRAAQDKVDNMLSGVANASPAALRFREQVSFAEMAFWTLVTSPGVGEARDLMAANGRKVREEISALDKRWQNLTEEDLRVEQAEQKAAQDIKEMLEQCLAEAMPLYVQVGAAAYALKDWWKGIGTGITDLVKETLIGAGAPRNVVEALLKAASWANDLATLNSIAQAAGVTVEVVTTTINLVRSINVGGLLMSKVKTDSDPKSSLVTTALERALKPVKTLIEGRYNDYMARYRAALDNEGIVIVSYGGIRQQVDEFLKKCSLQGTRDAHAAVIAALDRVESGLRTDGQKSDWSQVRNTMKDTLDKRSADTEKAFEDFYRANDGRFLGGLTTETERQLLEPERWRVTIDGVAAVGLDNSLRTWRQQMTVVNAGPKEAYDQMQSAYLGLPLDIRDKVQREMNGYLEAEMQKLNTEADKHIQALESCQLMVNAQKISSDMDRARLSQALRATIR